MGSGRQIEENHKNDMEGNKKGGGVSRTLDLRERAEWERDRQVKGQDNQRITRTQVHMY